MIGMRKPILKFGSLQSVRWPMGVTAQTKTSRHKQKLHGTNKNFTAQTKTLTAQAKTLTAQAKTSRHKQKLSRHKPKLSRHKRKLHGTNKNSHGTNENFTAQTKTLTAEVNLTAEMAVYFTRAVTQSLKIWRNR